MPNVSKKVISPVQGLPELHRPPVGAEFVDGGWYDGGGGGGGGGATLVGLGAGEGGGGGGGGGELVVGGGT